MKIYMGLESPVIEEEDDNQELQARDVLIEVKDDHPSGLQSANASSITAIQGKENVKGNEPVVEREGDEKTQPVEESSISQENVELAVISLVPEIAASNESEHSDHEEAKVYTEEDAEFIENQPSEIIATPAD
jgi:hypothetical protein